MKLDVHTHSILPRGEPFGCRLQVGLCFSGAVLPALMTHAAAAHMLGNLHPRKPELPTMRKIAELIRVLSTKYILAASQAYGTSPIPSCEFVLFGHDVNQTRPLEGGPAVAYRVMPSPKPPFQQVISRVNLERGGMAVIGADCKTLLEEIFLLKKKNAINTRGVEPRIALGNRMQARKHNTVGGSLQFGILSNGQFELYGCARDGNGNIQQNWLGFDCQNEMTDLIGMPIVIPARL
ncbi:hypothetical protein [Dyella acidiphila]|uniref:Uncharacterized protein n=1 Tax=Dyella acidiphila TaxID=2775866 RepID=A0ABR9GDL7_9GAMM|nr:hypothetical protein [Dyella acidiphila]MBE1162128.1 hypothetical protein [Dyella acidiphila]